MKAFLLIAVAAIGSTDFRVISETPIATMAECESLASNTMPVYTEHLGVSRIRAWCDKESETE